MTRVLITGANSYVGNCIKKWLSDREGSYYVEEVDTIGDAWEAADFSRFDTVVHVAAIVHLKENPSMAGLYDTVNAQLPVRVAEKAKQQGVRHFVFMSTMAVYPANIPFVAPDTPEAPSTFYGNSKLKAEKALRELASEAFCVSILRPPMVYGEGCKGNYTSLEAFSRKCHVFPRIYNKRSMIYIWNLCEFIRRIIDAPKPEAAVYYPQNKEQIGALDILKALWEGRGEKYNLSVVGAWFVSVLMLLPKTGTLKKVFRDSVYERSMSDYFDYEYCIYSFDESIKSILAAEAKS
ncbi:MAG: NAD-dependent epimerase/dehydratase family protein [Abditibacteriota bacterium]|nr:NAD-dependent epimerase/dehydratase family protein [Abditibacteriota bacterium]